MQRARADRETRGDVHQPLPPSMTRFRPCVLLDEDLRQRLDLERVLGEPADLDVELDRVAVGLDRASRSTVDADGVGRSRLARLVPSPADAVSASELVGELRCRAPGSRASPSWRCSREDAVARLVAARARRRGLASRVPKSSMAAVSFRGPTGSKTSFQLRSRRAAAVAAIAPRARASLRRAALPAPAVCRTPDRQNLPPARFVAAAGGRRAFTTGSPASSPPVRYSASLLRERADADAEHLGGAAAVVVGAPERLDDEPALDLVHGAARRASRVAGRLGDRLLVDLHVAGA